MKKLFKLLGVGVFVSFLAVYFVLVPIFELRILLGVGMLLVIFDLFLFRDNDS